MRSDNPVPSQLPAAQMAHSIDVAPTYPLSKRIKHIFTLFMAPIVSIFEVWSYRAARLCTFRAQPITPLTPEIAQVQPPHLVNPLIEQLAAIGISESAEQARTQDLKRRTESLLNASLQEIRNPSQDPTGAFKKIEAFLGWRQASLTQYSLLIAEHDPKKQEALKAWEDSYESLRQGYERDSQSEQTHATLNFEAIQSLPKKQPGSVVRYAGAFGKKQTLLQAILLKLHAHSPITALPPELNRAIEAGAVDSLENLFSYGIDLFYEQLVKEQPDLNLSEKLHGALEKLKPFLPDLKAHTAVMERVKTHLPNWLSGHVNETLQQGILSFFLDLVPDSLLRDQCVDLVHLTAQAAHTEDLPKLLAEWKQRFIQKTLSFLPLASLDDLNEEMEETFSSFLRGFDESLDHLAKDTLFSHGTYWLEWSYNHDKKTYSLAIYASGSALTNLEYPKNAKQELLWPIRLNNISLHSSLPQLLKKLSETTALAKRWKQPSPGTPPLSSEKLFGKDGLLTILKAQPFCAHLDETGPTLPSSSSALSPVDMVSHYHQPANDPAYLRYRSLRQLILEALSPFAKSENPLEPPRLTIPEGEEGASKLHLLQSAVMQLRKYAEKAGIDQEGFKEITACSEQIEEVIKARTPPARDKPLDSSNSSGLLLDKLLGAFCSADGTPHAIQDYKPLLKFILGPGLANEKFVDRLCTRAQELQAAEARSPTRAPLQAPVTTPHTSASVNSTAPSHRPRGAFGKFLYNPAMQTLLSIFSFIYAVETLLSSNFSYRKLLVPLDILRYTLPKILPQPIQDHLYALCQKLRSYAMKQLREWLFKSLFPHLEGSENLDSLRKKISPFIESIETTGVFHAHPIELPQPAEIPIKINPQAAISHKIVLPKPQAASEIKNSSSFSYFSQARCTKATHILNLPSTLQTWLDVCQKLPHLLIHQIHTLPIDRTSQAFMQFFDNDVMTGNTYQPLLHKSLQIIDDLGQLLFTQYKTIDHSVISWRDYQLAQFRLMAFTDVLIREVNTHPFGQCKIAAAHLLTEWSLPYTNTFDSLIYSGSQEHALTVIRYFYPQIHSLEDLLHKPPPPSDLAEWNKNRWSFGTQWCTSSQSPERLYYQKIARLSETLFLKDENQSLIPVKRAETEDEAIFDLMCVAHTRDECHHALHWTVPLATRQMARALCYTMKTTLKEKFNKEERLSLVAQKIHLTPLSSSSQLYLHECDTPHRAVFAQHMEEFLYNILVIKKPLLRTIDYSIFASNIQYETPTLFIYNNDPAIKLFYSDTFDRALSELFMAPSLALRLIAKHACSAAKQTDNLHKLILCMGNLEGDFKTTPAIIHEFAEGLKALFQATQNHEDLFSLFHLSLAIRSRAWKVDPHTTAFDFLSDKISSLFLSECTECQWRAESLRALHADHPAPERLPEKEQERTLALLLHALDQLETITCNYEFYDRDFSKSFSALQQMALRWYPIMQQRRCCPPYSEEFLNTLRSETLPPKYNDSPEKELKTIWQKTINEHGIKESIEKGAIPLSELWMERSPIKHQTIEEEESYTQEAHVYRYFADVPYTLLNQPDERSALLKTLTTQFPWLSLLKKVDSACWMLPFGDGLEGCFKTTLFVTESVKSEKQLSFVLEYANGNYSLLGLLEEDGQIVCPASRLEVEKWCMPLARFCPLSSIELLVNRQTGLPSRLHLSAFGLDFSLTETALGWKAESKKLYPGFWIATQQPFPFGLILENQEGNQQLLLPSQTLVHQSLYAQVDPLLGILGAFVQRQKFFHTQGSLYSYRRVINPLLPHAKARWVSEEPDAMVHLLNFYLASRKWQEMFQVGEDLLQMQLPPHLEMELLPLCLAITPKATRLYIDLLAKMESSLLSHAPSPPQKGLIGKYLPDNKACLISFINVYRILAHTNTQGLPDDVFHQLFARYHRLLCENRELLTELFQHKEALSLLSTDLIALHLLPKIVQTRILSLESAIGNRPPLIERIITLYNTWQDASSQSSHPWIKQLLTLQKKVTTIQTQLQIGWNIPYTTLKPNVKEWKKYALSCISPLKATSRQPVTSTELVLLSPRVHTELYPLSADPEMLTKENLIPYFLTHQAMAQGTFGKEKQIHLMQQLYVLNWTLPEGPEQEACDILRAIAKHQLRYSFFSLLYNRGSSLQKRLRAHQKEIAYQQQIEKQLIAELILSKNSLEVQKKGQLQLARRKEQATRHTAELECEWNSLTLYTNLQPKWDAVERVATRSICLFGTYYILPKLTDKVLTQTLSFTASRFCENSSTEKTSSPSSTKKQSILPLGIAAGVTIGATACLFYQYRKRKQSRVNALNTNTPPQAATPKKRSNRLQAFGITSKALSSLALTTLTTFTVRSFTHFSTYTQTPSIGAAATACVPSLSYLPTFNQAFTTVIPTITTLYTLHHFYRLKSTLTKRASPTITLQLSQPYIPSSCQQALHAQDQRWQGTLNVLFDAHFISQTVEVPPVSMEGLHSETMRASLTHYANEVSSTPRAVYGMRNKKSVQELIDWVDQELSKKEYLQNQELNDLFKALNVAPEDHRSTLEALRRFFALAETRFLESLQLSEKQKALLQEILPPFFLHETEKQQLQRIAKALHALEKIDHETDTVKWDAACEQLIMQMRSRRMYDISTLSPQRLSLFLAFESSTGTLLWKQQVDTVSAVLNAKGQSVAYELLMSLGKTFFAIPITALVEADGNVTVFLIWPEAMYATQTRETGEQLFLLGGRPVTPLHIDRSFPLTKERLDSLLRLIESTKNNKGAISTRKKDPQALQLLFVELLENLKDTRHLSALAHSKISKLKSLLRILRQQCVYLADEAHELFHDMTLHFPLGSKKILPSHDAFGVRKTMIELFKGELGEHLRSFKQLKDKAGSQELFEIERERIARKLITKNSFCTLDKKHHEACIAYLIDPTKPTPECLKNLPQQCESIDAARGVLGYLFPLFFSSRIGADFCLSKKDPHFPLVIPSDGNDNPSEQKRIATPQEALAKTLTYHWHHGIDSNRLSKMLKACDANSKKWEQDNHRPYEESPYARAFAKLFGPNNQQTLQKALDYVNQPEAIEKLFQPIIGSLSLLSLYSQCCLEPALECYQAQCSSSSLNFHSLFLRGKACSGTAFNAAIYPLTMLRQLNKATLGEAITHIKNKCQGVATLNSDKPQKILLEVLEDYFLSDKECTALIDENGLLTGLSHDSVARTMLSKVREKRPHIEVVDYFTIDTKTQEPICMSWVYGADKPVPKHTCHASLENRISYFDESHCFAANIPQIANGKGVLLMGAGQPLFKWAQGAFRMRGLKNYVSCLGLQPDAQEMAKVAKNIQEKDRASTQGLYIALSPQVGKLLSEEEVPPTLDAVINYREEQQEKMMEQIHFQGGLSFLQDTLRTHTMEALLDTSSVSHLRNHYKQSRSLFVTQTAQGSSALYGGARAVASGLEIMKKQYEKACQTVANNPLLSSAQKAAAKKTLFDAHEHIKQLPMPTNIPITIDVQGEYLFNIDGTANEMEVEVQSEVDREQETESQRQTQRQQEVQNKTQKPPLTIKPDPWSLTCPLNSAAWQWFDFSQAPSSSINSMKHVVRAFRDTFKKHKTQESTSTYTPPLFPLRNALAFANQQSLRDLSKKIDARIWWSNHLLPQVHLPFNTERMQPASSGQHPIVHLLIEVQDSKIISIGCLGPSDTRYWKGRLSSELDKHRKHVNAPQKERLFMLYQMPVLENMKQHYDGHVVVANQDSDWVLSESKDFKKLEVMIKVCNGDSRYTEEQCALLKEWNGQFLSTPKGTALEQAFTLFRTMQQERSLGQYSVMHLSDLIDLLDA